MSTGNAFIMGITSGIITVLIIRTIYKTTTFFRLKKLNGEYEGFDIGGAKHSDKKYKVNYCWFNILNCNNTLTIEQTSKSKGFWISKTIILDANPLSGSGKFFYAESKKFSKQWGTHLIEINDVDAEIYIHANNKSNIGTNEFVIKRKK